MNMLTLLLPGTAVTFAGDELGMESPILRYEDQRDPEGYIFGKDNYLKVCRDGSRVPFQWNDQENAGEKRGCVETRGASFGEVKNSEKMRQFHFLT
jgi:Glycosidases